MNLSLVPKFDPPSTGRTTLDMREAKPTGGDIEKPDRALIDKIAFALAERKFENETKSRGGE